MSAAFGGMPAAPNQCEIKAKVLQVDQSSDFPDKWYIEMEILESTSVTGPNFARVGEKTKGFTFKETSPVSPGDVIKAQAEFLGDERGGQFQLSEVAITRQGRIP